MSEHTRPWWLEAPRRMIQTNLREIEAETLDLDTYVQSIQDCRANVVLFNVGGIVANYPTELAFHYRNPFMTGDLVGSVLERLHAEGIRMIGRFDFSKVNEAIADDHPEWLYRSPEGETVNYNGQVHTCLNGAYQQECLFEILGEALDRYPLDGVFFNMIGYQTHDYSGNYHGLCQCDNCRRRFADMCGEELPTREDASEPAFRKYQAFRHATSDDLFWRVSAFIKSKGEGICLCTYTPTGVDVIRTESNSALDRPLPEWNYSASDNVKSALGSWRNKQVSNAAVHFVDIPYRHSAVSPHLTALRHAQNLIHGGWLDHYVIGTLEGQEDRHGLEAMREIFRFHAHHERLFTDVQSVADVCLVKPTRNAVGESRAEYTGLFRLLSENHALFDVMTDAALAAGETPKQLADYQVVVLPDLRNMSDALCQQIDEYVESGGKLLATGQSSTCDDDGNPLSAVRLRSLGVASLQAVRPPARGSYLRLSPSDHVHLTSGPHETSNRGPLEVRDSRGRLGRGLGLLDLVYLDGTFLECQLATGARGCLGLIPDDMFGPPEKCYYRDETSIPGLVHHRLGDGAAAFLPWSVGAHYQRRSNHGHSLLFMATLESVLGLDRSLVVDAPPLVEVSRHASRDGSFEWIGLVNHTGQLGTAFHEPVPVHDVRVELLTRREPKGVGLLHAGSGLPHPPADDWLCTTVPRLESFEVLLVEYRR